MLLSLCMIVRDEEENLERCLKSAQGLADETILVDTGSKDGTVRIASAFGADVHRFPWNDSFAEARNRSLELARGDWILLMDADDELEPGGREKILRLLRNAGDEELFCCKTLCYLGDSPDEKNFFINRNLRLIRNGRGYRFSGRIHEQIVSGDGSRPRVRTAEIRFYHYGYLNGQIERKEKRKRNIRLIRTELDENPGNAYMLFCMGNEFLAAAQAAKALAFYRRSLLLTDRDAGYRPALLVRMILCCSRLGLDRDRDFLIREGTRSCPNQVDFPFLKACALQRGKRPESAVRLYRKCLRMNPGNSRASGISALCVQYALGGAYAQLGESGKALRAFAAAARSSPRFREAWGKMVGLLLAEGRSPASVRRRMTRLAGRDFEACRTLSAAFYHRRMYRESLAFCRRARRLRPGENPALEYAEGICEFYLNQYGGAARHLAKAESGPFAADAAWYRLLSILFRTGRIPPYAKWEGKVGLPYYETARECLRCILGEAGAPFTDEAQKYREPVYCLLEILLAAGKTEAFRSSLALLGRIRDGSEHLRLGKLYFRYGYGESAYGELIRSIRANGPMDAEGLAILQDTFSSGDPTG